MTEPIIKPTPGRVMWYRPVGSGATEQAIPTLYDEPLAALVAGIHNTERVNLLVIGADGSLHPRQYVRIVHEGDVISEGESYAEWIPYQIGQAKKESA